MGRILFLLLLLLNFNDGHTLQAQNMNLNIGVLPKGLLNAITDVPGVAVGHTTMIRGDSVRTGVTAILPHGENLFRQKVPAAIFAGNGFGKITGTTQVKELGNLEVPIILTNTLSVPVAMSAVIKYTLSQKGNENVWSVNAVVGETNDGYLNDIRGMHIVENDVLNAIRSAKPGRVEQGNVGAGTGTVCFGYKGGIGTASRVLPKDYGSYTVGALVQSNFGGVLQMGNAPVGKELKKYYMSGQLENPNGSCMMVIATNAPLSARNLERLAGRAFMGMAKTGGIAANGSGDYVIAFSTDTTMRVPMNGDGPLLKAGELSNDDTSPLFLAAIEATEEAILNSLLHAKTITGYKNRMVESLPMDKVLPILKYYKVLK